MQLVDARRCRSHRRRPVLLARKHIKVLRWRQGAAVRDVRCAAGEVLCLAGENGCGKSTLIKIISGVYQPEPGAVMLIDGKPIDGLTPHVRATSASR